ncbi:MAG: TIGR01777 family oxidoreductase [Ginsengibacter sp.]
MPIVLISGGTGLIGTNLTRHLVDRNYKVIILSRDKKKTADNPKISYAYWDIASGEIDIDAVKKADHIMHLAGAGVMDKRWTDEFKKQIVESRTKSSELIIKALRENGHQVKSFVSASAIGWYGADAKPLIRPEGFIETDVVDKNSFLGETCLLWEASVEPVRELGIRLTKIRTGVVLSNKGGAYKEFTMASKFGIAGILGNGKQIISWIHIDDISRMYIELMENEYADGSYNGVAPTPVSNKAMMLQIAETLRRKFFIPVHVPEFLLKLALGKQSVEILKSATVSDKKIKAVGFTFLYPTIEAAVAVLAAKKSQT